jgi:hypothetical protein
MVDIPSPKDALVNLFMTLYVIFEATKRGEIDGRVKLMKLLQKAEEELTKKSMRGPSFVFYKWRHGAWSPEAQIGLQLLTGNGLVSEDKTMHLIMPTVRGIELINNSRNIIEKNRELLDIVNRVLASHVQYKSYQLRALTYGTPSLEDARKLIEQIKQGEVVLKPTPEEKASKFFLVDDDWLDRVAMSVSSEFQELLQQVDEKPKLSDYRSLSLLRKDYGLR